MYYDLRNHTHNGVKILYLSNENCRLQKRNIKRKIKTLLEIEKFKDQI
jgi:hypothetical protein